MSVASSARSDRIQHSVELHLARQQKARDTRVASSTRQSPKPSRNVSLFLPQRALRITKKSAASVDLGQLQEKLEDLSVFSSAPSLTVATSSSSLSNIIIPDHDSTIITQPTISSDNINTQPTLSLLNLTVAPLSLPARPLSTVTPLFPRPDHSLSRPHHLHSLNLTSGLV